MTMIALCTEIWLAQMEQDVCSVVQHARHRKQNNTKLKQQKLKPFCHQVFIFPYCSEFRCPAPLPQVLYCWNYQVSRFARRLRAPDEVSMLGVLVSNYFEYLQFGTGEVQQRYLCHQVLIFQFCSEFRCPTLVAGALLLETSWLKFRPKRQGCS